MTLDHLNQQVKIYCTSMVKNMEDNELPECAVCLQSCNHPAKLPCGHVFCFLCVKGVAILNKRCAMCRQDIPPDYLDHPVLLSNEVNSSTAHVDSDSDTNTEPCQWYYEGRNGWWKYDERSNSELEASYNAGETFCQLLLAGAVYHVDFNTMLQYRRTDITRRRRVKRDIPAAPAKGIAGIKTMSSVDSDPTKSVENDEESESNEEEAQQQGSSSSQASPQQSDATDAVIIPPPLQFDIADSLGNLNLTEDVENVSSEQE